MALSIFDIDMKSDYDVLPTGGAIFDVQLACNHRVISNLVSARLQTEIDWRLYVENSNIDDGIIAQLMRFTIDNTYGVASSDLTNFSSNRDGRAINFTGVCFVVDCDNSQECVTLL